MSLLFLLMNKQLRHRQPDSGTNLLIIITPDGHCEDTYTIFKRASVLGMEMVLECATFYSETGL